jgi:predicted esterase YcpF (UPF0227 family)
VFSAALTLSFNIYAENKTTGNDKLVSTELSVVPLSIESPLSALIADKKALKACKCGYESRFTVLHKNRSDLDKTSNEIYPYAIMSANAYDHKLQISIPGWKRIKRIKSNHGFSADIYNSDDEKSVVIAFRGTDDKKDWPYANLKLSPGGQYSDADDLFSMILKENSGKKIITTGHSLGGGLAIHISLANEGVEAFVFNPSPRIFAGKNYGKYDNRIVLAYESGEILESLRKLFTTLKKIKIEEYRYNFLGGNIAGEHSSEPFARCMYASINTQESEYSNICKDNTIGK